MGTATDRKPGDYITADKTRSCDRCGAAYLAWWKSTRTGRWMLVNTAPSRDDVKRARDVRYITPWSPHRCERELARRAKRDEELRAARLRGLTDPIYDDVMDAEVAGDTERARLLVGYAKRVRDEFEAGTFDGEER